MTEFDSEWTSRITLSQLSPPPLLKVMRASFSVIRFTQIVPTDRILEISGLHAPELRLCGHSISEKNAIL